MASVLRRVPKRNWLILSHCFNMDGRAASQTITDRIPFLLAEGVIPLVLSAPTGKKDRRFPHFQVLSLAPSGILFETRQVIEKKFSNRLLRKLLKAILTLACLPFYLIEKIFINLDSHWSWFISAVVEGWFIARKYKPEIIYSTAGPSSTHLAGLVLKKILGIPWVAEIHDPLISMHIKPRYQRYAFHEWLEKQIFYNAEAVIYFTQTALNNAEARIARQKGNGFVLRPGANPPKICKGIDYKKKEKIHFGHFGSLAKDRNLHDFMVALALVLTKYPDWRSKMVLDVYGTHLDGVSQTSKRKLGLCDVLREHGRLELGSDSDKSGRQQVFELMHMSDVLVLVHGDMEACTEYIPSKLYEYLLTGRPIVGIVELPSELATILLDNGHCVVARGDTETLVRVLEQLIWQWEKEDGGLPRVNKGEIFTVEKTVDYLFNIIDTVCK